MYNTHRTKEGDVMLVAEMEDSHLLNTIRLMLRNLAEARRIAESGNVRSDYFATVLSGRDPKAAQRQAKEMMMGIHATVQPYIAEAALRGIEITALLRVTYGRDKALERTAMPTALLGELDADYEIDDEYDPEFDHGL